MVLALIIGFAIYVSLPNFTGILILVVIGILAIWLGLKIFKRVQIVGIIEFITAAHASSDLDNLELTSDSETKRRKPEELVELLAKEKKLFKGGSFRIYGDWFGKPYDNYHKIESGQFDIQSNLMTLTFNEGVKLEIYNPKHIFESTSFFKR